MVKKNVHFQIGVLFIFMATGGSEFIVTALISVNLGQLIKKWCASSLL